MDDGMRWWELIDGPLSDDDLEKLTEGEHMLWEKGYIAGAVSQWKSLARMAVHELRSYGVEIEYREPVEES